MDAACPTFVDSGLEFVVLDYQPYTCFYRPAADILIFSGFSKSRHTHERPQVFHPATFADTLSFYEVCLVRLQA
jgi:hypothetical protein